MVKRKVCCQSLPSKNDKDLQLSHFFDNLPGLFWQDAPPHPKKTGSRQKFFACAPERRDVFVHLRQNGRECRERVLSILRQIFSFMPGERVCRQTPGISALAGTAAAAEEEGRSAASSSPVPDGDGKKSRLDGGRRSPMPEGVGTGLASY